MQSNNCLFSFLVLFILWLSLPVVSPSLAFFSGFSYFPWFRCQCVNATLCLAFLPNCCERSGSFEITDEFEVVVISSWYYFYHNTMYKAQIGFNSIPVDPTFYISFRPISHYQPYVFQSPTHILVACGRHKVEKQYLWTQRGIFVEAFLLYIFAHHTICWCIGCRFFWSLFDSNSCLLLLECYIIIMLPHYLSAYWHHQSMEY